MWSQNGAFLLKKNKDGIDFRYFRKCRHFKNISFELGVVDYSQLPIFILIWFWEIKKFLMNGLRESACRYMRTVRFSLHYNDTMEILRNLLEIYIYFIRPSRRSETFTYWMPITLQRSFINRFTSSNYYF
jgi:hypothetical protein